MCYLIYKYFPCPKNTFNKILPQEEGLIERGLICNLSLKRSPIVRGTYLQFELEKGGLVDRGAY